MTKDELMTAAVALDLATGASPATRRAARVRVDARLREARALLASNPRSAIEVAQAVLDTIENTRFDRQRGVALRHVGVGQYILGKHLQAYAAFERSLGLARAVSDFETQLSCLNGLAAASHGLGELESALHYLSEALALSQATRNDEGELCALINTANALQDMQHHERAEGLYRQVLARPRMLPEQRAIAVNNLANTERALGRLDAASEGHESALRMVRENGLAHREPMVLGNLAESLMLRGGRGDLERALSLLSRALDLVELHALDREELQILLTLGKVRAHRGEKEMAATHFRRAHVLAQERSSPRDARDALEQLAILLNDPGLWREVLEAERALERAGFERRRQVLELRTEFEKSKQELRSKADALTEMAAVNARLREATQSLELTVKALDPRPAASATAAPGIPGSLTPRETQVLGLVAKGLTNEGVAKLLGLRPLTVRHHVSSILRKTGARSRAHAVALCASGAESPGS